MDFGFDSDIHKTTTASQLEKGAHGDVGASRQEKDHSPTSGGSPFHASDKLQKSTSGSGSTDDFEHVDHDPFMSDSFPPSSGNVKGPAGGNAGNLLDDFLGEGQKQFDSFKKEVGNEFAKGYSGAKDTASDFMSGFDDKISMTRDFMAMERGGYAAQKPAVQNVPQAPVAPISPVVTQAPTPAKRDFFDDEPVSQKEQTFKGSLPSAPEPTATAAAFKDEKTVPIAAAAPEKAASFGFFDSPVKKISKEDNEKFISSEDLLGDFSDARRTPEPAFSSSPKPELVAPSAPTMPQPAAPAPVFPPQPKEEPKLPEPAPAPRSVPKPQEVLASAAPTKLIETVQPAAPEPTKAPEPVKPSTSSTKAAATKKPMISAEEIFCRYGLDAWFKPDRLHPVVESLIYWRDVKKSGIVFGAGLVILLAISCFSVISVFAYLSLIGLTGAIAFRIYKNVLGAIQKTSEGHPFKECLEYDLTISQEKAQNVVGVVIAHINGFVAELRRLFLVEDLVDSIKFGVILWVLTYIGAWFNGMTLVILAFVALFTLPKVYENNKESIDTYLDLVRSKILEITDKVKAAIPIGKKQETEKDK